MGVLSKDTTTAALWRRPINNCASVDFLCVLSWVFKTSFVLHTFLSFLSIQCQFSNTSHLEMDFHPDVLSPGAVMEVPLTFYPREAKRYHERLTFTLNSCITKHVDVLGQGIGLKVRFSDLTLILKLPEFILLHLAVYRWCFLYINLLESDACNLIVLYVHHSSWRWRILSSGRWNWDVWCWVRRWKNRWLWSITALWTFPLPWCWTPTHHWTQRYAAHWH